MSETERHTSAEIASIAGHVLSMKLINPEPTDACGRNYNKLLEDAKALAGSCLSQAAVPESDKLVVPCFTEIDWQRVGDLITSALEGSGSVDWIASFHAAPDDLSQKLRNSIKAKDGVWYYEGGSFWKDGGKAVITYDSGNTGGERSQMDFDKSTIELGLRRMADQSRQHFNDFITENDDAITSDVFMQYAVLGEIVYG